MCAYWRPYCFLQAIDCTERKAWSTVTEDDWCDHHMQTIEAACLKKTRHGVWAAFDQHPAQAKVGESGKYYGGRNISTCCRKRQDFHTGKFTVVAVGSYQYCFCVSAKKASVG